MTMSQRKSLSGLDIESIRLPLEVDLSRRLEKDVEVKRMRAEIPPPDIARARRHLLGDGLRLTEEMAPDVHEIAHEVQRILAVDKPFELFQLTSIGGAPLNVGVTYTARDPILIIIEGRVIADLGDKGVAAALGHEFGHYLAHGPDSPLKVAPEVARAVGLSTFRETMRRLALSYSMAIELTADRFSLLVTKDVEDLIGVVMVLASGLPSSALKGGPRAYLDQCKALMEELLEKRDSALEGTHPEHALRAYAAWLYSETDAFAELTGAGPATRSIDDVNLTLGKLLIPDYTPGAPVRTVRFGKRGFGAPKGPQPGFNSPKSPGAPRSTSSSPSAGSSHGDAKKVAGSVVDGAARTYESASKAVKPGISKLKKATAEGVARMVGRKGYVYAEDGDDEPASATSSDLAFEDPAEADLLDRFAELERQMKEED